jgi:protein required for attachment to host cells
MAQVWVLVADSDEARIYATRSMRSQLELIDTLTHEASRLHARDLGSDRPGRVHDRFGPGRHSLDQGQQLKNTEKQRFAREIAAQLAEGQRLKKFDRLVIMAGPPFLGILRDCLGKALSEAVVATVPKDLVAQDVAAIQAHLP